jgi:hypothetical protein
MPHFGLKNGVFVGWTHQEAPSLGECAPPAMAQLPKQHQTTLYNIAIAN